MNLKEMLEQYDSLVESKEVLIGGIRFNPEDKDGKFEIITSKDEEIIKHLKQVQWEMKYVALDKFRRDHEAKFNKTELKQLDSFIKKQKKDNKEMINKAEDNKEG